MLRVASASLYMVVLDIKQILGISPTFHMHNTKPTYGKKNIDVLVSDMVHLFDEPVIIYPPTSLMASLEEEKGLTIQWSSPGHGWTEPSNLPRKWFLGKQGE